MAGGGYYSDRSIERVRASTDIATVIGRYVNLKRSGSSIKGLCPFHKEKTPSFFVSPERQMYHCFGCGAGGDVFSFLMNYLSFSFSEAVEELAAEAGIELEKTGRDTSRSDVFREILSASQDFYRGKLKSGTGQRAREYLASRDISAGTIEKLGLGWAPQGSELSEHLIGKGYSESQLIESGVSLKSRRGSGIYDRFRGRILFPISDRRGRVISFGGRILDKTDDRAPKYLNGPDSPIYSKGDYLYGYRTATGAARDLDMIVLVEGYFDHARFVEVDFECVVATCGTALTPAQARQIGGMASSVLICYDGDSSGQRASVRAAEVLLQQGYMPRIIHLPKGQDPDDYLRGRSGEAVLELAGKAPDPIRYALGLLGGWSSITGTQKKIRVVRRLTDVASSASEPVIRETLLKVISSETGYSLSTLQEELERKEKRSGKPSVQASASNSSQLPRWDRRILESILLSAEGLADPIVEFIEPEDLRSPEAAAIFSEIRRQAENGLSDFQISRLDDSQRSVCAMIYSGGSRGMGPEDRQRLETAVMKERLERERRELKQLLRSGEAEDRLRLQQRIIELEKRITDMRTGGGQQ